LRQNKGKTYVLLNVKTFGSASSATRSVNGVDCSVNVTWIVSAHMLHVAFTTLSSAGGRHQQKVRSIMGYRGAETIKLTKNGKEVYLDQHGFQGA
jgi:hypothetical protein